METGSVRHRRGGDSGARDPQPSSPGHAQGEGSRMVPMFVKGILTGLTISIVTLLIIALFLSSPIEPESFSLPTPPAFEGALAPNDVLAKGERLWENKLLGPESVIVQDGHMYTGTADGKILHIQADRIETVATLGKPPCGGFENEPHCGRPLGMRFDQAGYLVVVDAYLGLYKVNVVTGDVHQYFPSTMKIDGKESKFLNDLDIGSDGIIYITDSSTKWDRRHNRYAILENGPYGRLLKYDPATNTTSVLADGLHFPNGVQLSKQEDYILVTQSTMARVLRYHLKGPKAGELDVFADNLPMLPDNIRRSGRGGYWVAGAGVRDPSKFQAFDFAANKPWLRKFATKIFNQEALMKIIAKPYGLIIELDKQGHVVRSLHDPSAKVVPAASEVEEDMGILYIGSYYSPFIVKLDLRKAGAYDSTPLK